MKFLRLESKFKCQSQSDCVLFMTNLFSSCSLVLVTQIGLVSVDAIRPTRRKIYKELIIRIDSFRNLGGPNQI